MKAGLLSRETLVGRIPSVCQPCLELKPLEVLVGLLYVKIYSQQQTQLVNVIILCNVLLLLAKTAENGLLHNSAIRSVI